VSAVVVVEPVVGVAVVTLTPDATVAVTVAGAPALAVSAIGYPGPAGRDGAAAAAYVHTQSAPSATWVMNHNLGYAPNVELRTTGGVLFDGQVTHVSVNQAVGSFAVPIAGTARFI
jgi:hypothetical protein